LALLAVLIILLKVPNSIYTVSCMVDAIPGRQHITLETTPVNQGANYINIFCYCLLQ